MIYFIDFEVYLKSKIVELQLKHGGDKDSDHGDYYVDDGPCSSTEGKGIYSQMEPISKRKSIANESKASVYFTPTESIDQTQLQLSPIHINYIRENAGMDAFAGCIKPPPLIARKLFFQSMTFRSLEKNRRGSAIADDDDLSETESTIMITTENDAMPHTDYIPMNILSKCTANIRSDSKDMYYSLENVFDAKTSPMQSVNGRTTDESSDVHLSNSSASDSCNVEDEITNTDWANGKVTPEKDFSTTKNRSMSPLTSPSPCEQYLNRVDSEDDFNELYPSSSLPNIKRTISALAEVHCSKDFNGTHAIVAIEPSDTQQSKAVTMNGAVKNDQMIETV